MKRSHLGRSCEEPQTPVSHSTGAQVQFCKVGQISGDDVDDPVSGDVSKAEGGEGRESREGGAQGVAQSSGPSDLT